MAIILDGVLSEKALRAAAGALGVTPQAVRERLAAGTLPGRKIGRNWALPASALHR